MIKGRIRNITMALSVVLLSNLGTPVFAKGNGFVGEYPHGEILSFGSSLNKTQEKELRDYFKAPDTTKAIYVDTAMAVKQLGLDKSMITSYKGGWYSSAYVKLTDGKGMNVEANNLTLVTEDMLGNALITSGILNADVVASAPFKVTGESALAGILAGAEEIMGSELSQDNKETAQKEIETTLGVADEIGKKEASTIMNEIKAEIIKDSPINITQIEKIVINVTNNYGVELSDKTRARVVETMSDINDLGIDYKEVKGSLKSISERLFSDLKEASKKGEEMGMKIKESGFFQKMWESIKDFFNSILDIFRKNDDSSEEDQPLDNSDEMLDSTNDENGSLNENNSDDSIEDDATLPSDELDNSDENGDNINDSTSNEEDLNKESVEEESVEEESVEENIMDAIDNNGLNSEKEEVVQ